MINLVYNRASTTNVVISIHIVNIEIIVAFRVAP